MISYVLSFSGYLLGQNSTGLALFLIALSQGMGGVTVLKPYSQKGEVVYAGFWLRLGSGLADTFFRAIVFILVYFVSAQFYVSEIGKCLPPLIYLVIELFTLKALGQTPGDMLMGIQVVKLDLSKVTWVEVILRMFVRILYMLGTILTTYLLLKGSITHTDLVAHPLSSNFSYKDFADRLWYLMVFWTGSEFFVLLTNRRKRALQDLMAGTVVVLSPAQERPRPILRGGFFALATVILLVFAWIWSEPILRAESDQGDPKSQQVLGNLYFRGWTVRQDYGQALYWYQKSAALGDADAQLRIGQMYDKGLGVTKDPAEAIKWYTQAAQNGNWVARAMLKKMGVTYAPNDKKP